MIYPQLLHTLKSRKLFILLIDPDKLEEGSLVRLLETAGRCGVDLLLVGGSLVSAPLDKPLSFIRSRTSLPVVLFPGSLLQVSPHADGILLLSLISGRNPEYLIGNHVIAAPLLKHSGLEIIPTGYILVENGRSTSVEYISQTKPIPADKVDIATATAMAGEMLGLKLLYLEAGSGALKSVPADLIRNVKQNTTIPLFVGGGIRTPEDVAAMYEAGADAVVVGTAIENYPDLLCSMASVPRS